MARLFVAPRKGTRASLAYHGLVSARVTPVKNDARAMTEEVHFVRAQQKLFQEWHHLYGQPVFSGDDMNIIQVGRPAVSRYHRNRSFFLEGHGPNFDVHDFALAELGVKLGGFMVLEPPQLEKSALAHARLGARPRSASF